MRVKKKIRNNAIIEDYIAGKTYRELSAKYGLANGTLAPILNSDEAHKIQLAAYNRRIALIPRAIEREIELLESDNEQIALKVIHKLQDDTGIGTSRTLNSVHVTLNQDNRTLITPAIQHLFDSQAADQDAEEAEFEVVD